MIAPRARGRRGGKRDLDAEPALGASVQGEAAVVGGGDRGDDREAESVAVLRSGPVLAEAFERLGELRDGRLLEQRAAAVDDEPRPLAVKRRERELDRAARAVVAHGVLDHVLDHALEQRGAAGDLERGEVGLDRELLGGDLLGAGAERAR